MIAGEEEKFLKSRFPLSLRVTVHRLRVQGSGLRTKKALKTRSLRYNYSFSQIIANLAPNFGLGLTKLTLFS